MLRFSLNATSLATDVTTANGYSQSANPGATGPTDSNDPYGMWDYFLSSGGTYDPVGSTAGPDGGGYQNMGYDDNGNYYWQKGSTSWFCRVIANRIRCRTRTCCPCIATSTPCNPNIACPTCAGHDIIPTPDPIPTPPGQITTGIIVPLEGDIETFNTYGRWWFSWDITPLPPVVSYGTVANEAGEVGDPHFEGFDRAFDFHGETGKYYQLYKSEKLIINAKIAPAYHCQTGGTFVEGLYIYSYKNGKEFEIVFSIFGTADLSHVFEPISKLNNNFLAYHAQSKSFKEEFNNNKWTNQKGSLVKTDVGDIYLIQSSYLSQPHINFKFVPNKMLKLENTTGILGQTQNMKMRLPNESFEINDIFSKDIPKIITPDMYFPVRYFGMGKEPCFTCQDKLKKEDVYVDTSGKKWIVDDNVII